ncbi:TonB-dependent receptor [Steroidobacter cummioxidans]|uniref:TonB-dependent receptor n=1 Tax=Steroidobacter cummioxidans TaxID=1803913 RepID=UPI0012907C7D|nr:TonB-dependent receptor [Steroidobacter cummioxidans]
MSTNNRTFRSSVRFAPRAAALTGSVLTILAAAVNAQAMTEWDLPEQPLAKSLREIAAQTDSNILFDKKLVDDQSAPPLKMKATTEQALKQVLEGTGLTYRHLDDKTVTIQLASANAAATTSASYGASNGRIRLAQAEMGESSGMRRGRLVEGRPLEDIEEIIVTGTNIRGIENNTAPVTVLSRSYIDATGYSTTAKLLESVTQNFALANRSGYLTPGVSGNNREQGSSINLRGIGEGTTLVLLNGRRLAPGYRSAAVDISALPLSAIDRVEILPDGASALYGSDAVGGVVNFILRDDFEGAETRLRAGTADSTNEYRASQAVGNSWGSGNFIASVEYYQRDLLLATDRDFIPNAVRLGSIAPEDENYSALLTGRQTLGGSVSMFLDALYTRRDSFNRGGRIDLNETTQNDNDQAVATLGVDWNVAGDWQIELAGSYARNEIDQFLSNSSLTGVNNNVLRNTLFTIEGAEMKADGSLFSLPGGSVRAAIGVGYRSETYEELSVFQRTGATSFAIDVDQNIKSAFGEVYVPFVGKDNAITGVQALELSLAGRYDDYSSAGSSFDPQAGVMWEPVGGLRLRARYGTSYKAPNLVDYTLSSNLAQAGPTNLPGRPYLLQVGGIDVDSLRPQESESSSFGLELMPVSLPGFVASLNYYKIRYDNLVATPANGNAGVILANPAAYQDIIFNNPSVDLVNQFIAIGRQGRGFAALNAVGMPDPNFTPSMVTVIVDGRRRNLSLVRAEGVDLATQYEFKVGSSSLFFGLNGTYILNQEQQVTATSPEIDTVDTIYNPPDWRARGFVGWRMQGWSANVFVNHTDAYIDNRLVTRPTVDSYTTIDARVAYDFSARFNRGFLSGLSVALSAQNLADKDPPPVALVTTTDVGFDATNADPLGRFISLEISKSW